MKVRDKVNDDEILNHHGDLTILGNVGKRAKINLDNGSLIIKGDVEEDSVIHLHISKEWHDDIMTTSNAKIRAVLLLSDIGVNKPVITSHNKMGNAYWGNVNIDNKVFTNDPVIDLGNGKFEISNTQVGYTKVIINKREYQGNKILVILNKGELSFAINGQFINHHEIKYPDPPVCKIYGNVRNNVIILADANIDINGTLGLNVKIQGRYAKPVIHYHKKPIKTNMVTQSIVNEMSSVTPLQEFNLPSIQKKF